MFKAYSEAQKNSLKSVFLQQYLRLLLQNLQAKPKSYSVDRTDLEIDRLRGDMGLTQIQKGKKPHLFILSQDNYQKPKNSANGLHSPAGLSQTVCDR